ncbi:trypsin-like peptidase domain-containing protein [Hymenobacter sp. 5516J-16]|uniref:Trypsin-like peptidase domain-containing protein n=1 Tax=Hymenobacter sublimis TaxID=2933777 RepID=A0ABY4JBM6_9BACT|nr:MULTISPECIES: trypsin-like peptidase domain-containing protein [Hymenobacter]UOQ75595.1 trypsin-like peptidase domain-containing protein [Hymenobacter sp. 5516J-16]UPL49264.1 trypsin-like peptidase domain-containing protein [Hymenobacter sublimis]
MKTEADYYALFDAYRAGTLPDDERAALERRLSADSELARRLQEFEELTGTLTAYGRRLALRRKLHAIHADMDAEQAVRLTPLAKVAEEDERHERFANGQAPRPALRISRTEQKLRAFWNSHRATMMVAASVAVMAVFATLLGLEWWRASQKSSLYGYTVLRREVERIKRTQRSMNRTLTQIESQPERSNPGKFSGTGFALTADGYLVTSYHVIQGADSLLIEGHDRQRFRAEPVFTDVAHDLAILQIKDKGFKGFGRLPYAFKRGQSDLGEKVYTLGYPREDLVFNDGSLSARSGFEGDTGFYQISIPVNPGNSGGPLLDDKGNLIGVISGRQMDVQSAAFATKSSYLMRLVDSLGAAGAGEPYNMPRTNQLTGTSRPQQIRKLQDYVFVVKVYE